MFLSFAPEYEGMESAKKRLKVSDEKVGDWNIPSELAFLMNHEQFHPPLNARGGSVLQSKTVSKKAEKRAEKKRIFCDSDLIATTAPELSFMMKMDSRDTNALAIASCSSLDSDNHPSMGDICQSLKPRWVEEFFATFDQVWRNIPLLEFI
jgi:hypothetical protein